MAEKIHLTAKFKLEVDKWKRVDDEGNKKNKYLVSKYVSK